MRLNSDTVFSALLGIGSLVCPGWGRNLPPAQPRVLPARLRWLASQAKNPAGWPALRAYAASKIPAQDRGFAWFVVGYREYEAEKYGMAAEDLAKAASTDFSLADLAVYYQADADYEGGEPAQVIPLLRGFSPKHPQSSVLDRAVELLAWAYLQTGQPAQAVRTLTSYPDTRAQPALALLLSRSYKQAGRLVEAAHAFQDVYYAFPATSQAKVAAESLAQLRAQLGARLPGVPDGIATARAEKLYSAARFEEALGDFDSLLQSRPNSPLSAQWRLGRARCLLRLGRQPEAIQTLISSVPISTQLDAARLRILVRAYLNNHDEDGMDRALNQLRTDYSTSVSYAEALLSVAGYFMRKGNSDLALVSYQTVAQSFPRRFQGEEASWRMAWLACLRGEPAEASADFLQYIERYPASRQVAGALYFLGRLAQERGDTESARGFYALLRSRFDHSYYAMEAAERIKALGQAAVTERGAEENQPQVSAPRLAAIIPHPPTLPFDPCLLPASAGSRPEDEEAVGPFLSLASLGLDDLAVHGVESVLSHHPSDPGLIFILSRLEAARGRTDVAIHLLKKLTLHGPVDSFADLPQEYWALLYPSSFWPRVRSEAVAYGLNPYLVMALIRQESGFYERAVSPSNALGLMQILVEPRSRRAFRLAPRLYNPAYNLRAGCAYLRQLLSRYHGNWAETLAAYNAGPSRVDKWLKPYTFRDPEDFIETIPFPGTRVYVQAVLRDAVLYRRMLTGRVRYKTCQTGRRTRRPSSRRVDKRAPAPRVK